MSESEQKPTGQRIITAEKQHLNFLLGKADNKTGWRGPWAAPNLQGDILGVLNIEEIYDLPRLGNRPQKTHTNKKNSWHRP